MKKILLLIGVLFCMVASLFAQGKNKPACEKDHPDCQMVMSMKKQFFQDSLSLSAEEAAAFWQVFDENQRKELEIHENFNAFKEQHAIKTVKGHVKLESLDDATAALFVEEKLKTMSALADLEVTYFKNLKKTLPTDKVVKYYKLEKKFRHKIVGKKH